MLTHIIIDAENGVQNREIQIDLLSIANEMVLYGQDKFIEWLKIKLDNKEEDNA